MVEQCREKLGFEPYPGTVNLHVLPEHQARWAALKARSGALLAPPEAGFCDALCHRVTVDGRLAAATMTPHVANYPKDKLELLAPVNVMEALGLELGSEVVVETLE